MRETVMNFENKTKTLPESALFSEEGKVPRLLFFPSSNYGQTGFPLARPQVDLVTSLQKKSQQQKRYPVL